MSKTLFRLSTVYKKHDEAQKIITEFIDEIIKEKIKELNQIVNVPNDILQTEDGINRKMKTVIEILLENYHKMSHEQLRDELVTIMIGKYS